MQSKMDEAFFQSRGYYPLERSTVLRITGRDRNAVVNNLCTADLRAIEPGQAREAFITNVRGRCIGHGIIFAGTDDLWIFGCGQQAEGVLPLFDKYVIREDAAAEDFSDRYRLLFVPGLQRENLPAALREIAAARSDVAQVLPAQALEQLSPGLVGAAVRVEWASAGDVLLAFPADQHAEVVGALLQDLQVSDAPAFELARIRHRWPIYGIDFSDANLPQEIDRDAIAISFTKGCYLGQETVARLDALGQVQRKLVRWQIASSTPPPAGSELTAGEKKVGTITSATTDPATGQVIALGYARRTHFDPGSRAELDGVEATVLG